MYLGGVGQQAEHRIAAEQQQPVVAPAAGAPQGQGCELMKAGGFFAGEVVAENFASHDAKEGPRAFAEKRKPEWTGR